MPPRADAVAGDAPVGVFDSGVGGLSVLRALRARLPHQAFIHVVDSGHAPHGDRSSAHVAKLVLVLAALQRHRNASG